MPSKLDVPGQLKMATLEEATKLTQRLHGLVERMASAVNKLEPTSSYSQQIRRAGAPLVSLLKANFGLISDHVAQMMIIAGRTGSDRVRARALREGVGQLKQQLEIAATRTQTVHAVKEEEPTPPESA
ncbi:MAG: hypothetical protein ACT4P6_13735 [Gemmatimonadaceae bacterium]